jgi:hypothetical protein
MSASFASHRRAIAAGRFIRVLNYHNTPESAAQELRTELAGFAKRFGPVTLDDLDHFFATGDWRSHQPGLIPVFYEGYRNSAEVAAPICDELGLTGWFPICTAFVDCPVGQQEVFARSHYIGLVQEHLDHPGERIAISWDEIADLSTRHVVTPHTAAHLGINDTVTDEDLEREVFEPKRKMDAVTGQSAPAFAWLHGTRWGMSERHDRAVQAAGYRYLISNTMIHRIA